jgi:hypothetical protein
MVVKRSLSLSLALEGFRVKMLALHVLGYLMPVLLFVTHAKIRAIQSGIVHPVQEAGSTSSCSRVRGGRYAASPRRGRGGGVSYREMNGTVVTAAPPVIGPRSRPIPRVMP